MKKILLILFMGFFIISCKKDNETLPVVNCNDGIYTLYKTQIYVDSTNVLVNTSYYSDTICPRAYYKLISDTINSILNYDISCNPTVLTSGFTNPPAQGAEHYFQNGELIIKLTFNDGFIRYMYCNRTTRPEVLQFLN